MNTCQWESKWRNLLEKPDGSIDVEQLKLVLCDFDWTSEQYRKLVCHVTGDRLTDPTRSAQTVINTYENVLDDDIALALQECQDEGFCSFCNQEILDASHD